jgi:hypothetical protein
MADTVETTDVAKEFRAKLIVESAITAIVVVALSAGVLFFGGSIERSVTRIGDQRMELLGRWTSLKALAGLLSDYNDKAKGYLAVMEQMLPAQSQVFNLNKEFQALSVRGGVQSTFTFVEEKPAEEGMLGSIRYQLNVVGDTDALSRFLVSVEHFKYVSAVDNVRYERGTPKSTMVVQGKVFYKK